MSAEERVAIAEDTANDVSADSPQTETATSDNNNNTNNNNNSTNNNENNGESNTGNDTAGKDENTGGAHADTPGAAEASASASASASAGVAPSEASASLNATVGPADASLAGANPPASAQAAVRTCGYESCMVTTNLRPCYACMSEYYCSRECQVKDWPRHLAACAARRFEHPNGAVLLGGDGDVVITAATAPDPETVPRLFEYWQSVLSADQMARVRAFHTALKAYVKFSPAVLVRLVEAEIDPEREITGWERLVEAYNEVIASRPGKTSKLLKARIYGALHAMCAHGAQDIDALKKASVHCKKLGAKRGQLEKIVEIWQEAGCLQPIATWATAGGKKKKKKKGKGKGKGKGRGR